MEELDIKELFNMFWSRKVYVAIITAIFLVIGIIYTYMFVTPDYASSTTIILAQSGSKNSTTEGTESTITTSDLTLNQKLVSTYSELIKSKNILGEVIDHLGLKMSEGTLQGRVSVTAVKDTDLIRIRATDPKPNQAKEIAEEIANVFIDKVAKGVYNINNVQVWDKAEAPTSPYNISHTKDILLFVAVGLVVSAGYVFVANMLDTTVKSKEDVENKVGLSVLSTIPMCNFEMNSKVVKKGGKRR